MPMLIKYFPRKTPENTRLVLGLSSLFAGPHRGIGVSKVAPVTGNTSFRRQLPFIRASSKFSFDFLVSCKNRKSRPNIIQLIFYYYKILYISTLYSIVMVLLHCIVFLNLYSIPVKRRRFQCNLIH